jgi:hypothetical protein
LCQGKSGPILTISDSAFLAANGNYDKNYTLAVRIDWTRKSGVKDTLRGYASL